MALLSKVEEQQILLSMESLTDAEIVILRAVSIGLSTKQIAGLFGLKICTVEKQRERVMSKTGAANFAQLGYIAGRYWFQIGIEKLLLTQRKEA